MIILWLICTLVSFAEQAPPAEYPYPERRPTALEDIEQPIAKDPSGAYYYDTSTDKQKKSTYQGVEQPKKIGEDGTYYYSDDEDESADNNNGYPGAEQPVDKDSEGGYYYKRRSKNKKVKSLYGEQPSKVTEDGAYYYDLNPGPVQNTLSFRLGIFSPPKLTAPGGTTYASIYGSKAGMVMMAEYDWRLSKQLSVKVGSGVTVSDGHGHFASSTSPIQPKETFQFYIFPNTLSFTYKLQLWDVQWITPYVEGGPGYFTFVEARSDGGIFAFDGTSKYGGAFTMTAGGGLLFSLSKFMQGSALLTDYGASQAWVDIHFRQVIGIDKRKDFTSNMITAGIALGF